MSDAEKNVIYTTDRECGCCTGVVMDLPGEADLTADTVARWIREGGKVGRCSVADLRSGSVLVGHTCAKRVKP